MKLSAYQLKIVAALKHGSILYSLSGLHGHCWIEGVRPNPSFSTIDALKRAGMLTVIRDDWRGTTWKWSGKDAES